MSRELEENLKAAEEAYAEVFYRIINSADKMLADETYYEAIHAELNARNAELANAQEIFDVASWEYAQTGVEKRG